MDPRGGDDLGNDDERGRLRDVAAVEGDGATSDDGGGADGGVAAREDQGDCDGDGDGFADEAEAEAVVSSSNSARYRRGDRVYARDDSARRGVYEATIREVEHRCHRRDDGDDDTKDGDTGEDDRRRYTYRYLVHYLGWNKKWDRWVDEVDVMDIDSAAGREAAERLREEDRVAKERERAKREQKRENKKRKRQQQLAKQQASVEGDGDGDDDGDMCDDGEVEMPSPLHDLPFTLRTILIDDRENITRRCHQPSEAEWYVGRLLYNLPAPVTVKAALERFLSEKEKKLLLDRDKLRRKEKEKGKEKEKEPPKEKEKDPPKEKEKDPQVKDAVDRERKPGDGRDGEAREGDGGGSSDLKGGGCDKVPDDRDAIMRSWRHTVEGLLDLFDVALPLVLLYEQERLQYASMMRSINRRATTKGGGTGGGGGDPRQQHRRPCEMYGCEHLLRLFVRLPAMITAARFASNSSAPTGPSQGDGNDGGDGDGNVDERRKPSAAAEIVATMGDKMVERLEDVVRYLQGNVGRVFRPAYREPHERELTSAERALRERAGRKRARLLRERESEKEKGAEKDVVDKVAKKAGGDSRTTSAKSSR